VKQKKKDHFNGNWPTENTAESALTSQLGVFLVQSSPTQSETDMDIKILTAGCCNQNAFYDRVDEILESSGMEASVERVKDMEEVMKYGVMSTPALVIDGEVQIAGRAPSSSEIADLLQAS